MFLLSTFTAIRSRALTFQSAGPLSAFAASNTISPYSLPTDTTSHGSTSSSKHTLRIRIKIHSRPGTTDRSVPGFASNLDRGQCPRYCVVTIPYPSKKLDPPLHMQKSHAAI
ncbi:hypothetical protein GJ744_000763 [Endocarpon pusillum]|uniref:Uncharacterized protein n=1 Tax=Endocarpon pusillum TaxID=364733 RepID=A0A8H7E3P3_9EURO|nr:hypothetical protein GJ744_000763 [Endocarpon pusillum]